MPDEVKAEKKLPNRIADKFTNSQNSLLQRFGKSLRRDDSYPVKLLVKKGFYYFYYMLLAKIHFRKCTSSGSYTRAEYKPYVVNDGEIHIGDHVRVCSRKVACDLVSYPGGLLKIGNATQINFGTTICAQKKIKIGKNVRIGPYCMVHDTDFHIPGKAYKKAKGVPIVIEDNAWLSSRVIVMKGAVIGKGSVIAAGSVVSGIIPPNVVAGGIPAKVIKHLKPENDQESQNLHQQTELAPEDKQKVDEVLENVSNFEINQLDRDTYFSEIPEWSTEKHRLVFETLKELFSLELSDRDFIKAKKIGRIYDLVEQS